MPIRNRVLDIATTSFDASDTVLFDANVWLFIRRPDFTGSNDREKKLTGIYTAALRDILAAGTEVVLDVLVLSEYLNRFLRMEMRAFPRRRFADFKRFRQSPHFRAVGLRAAGHAKEILRITECRDHEFEPKTVEQAIERILSGTSDFNDEMLIETCRRNGWKMVTHDGDFEYGGIEVLTANRRLIERFRDSRGGGRS